MRSKEIYVSSKTKKRLYWIMELLKQSMPAVEESILLPPAKIITVDEIADNLLNQKIEENYPNIKVLEKRIDELEGQLISELLNPSEEK